MLGLAKRVGARFLLTSTSEVYGDPLQHPQVETYWGNVNPIGTFFFVFCFLFLISGKANVLFCRNIRWVRRFACVCFVETAQRSVI